MHALTSPLLSTAVSPAVTKAASNELSALSRTQSRVLPTKIE